MPSVKTLSLRTSVTSVKIVNDLLLAGIGDHLHIFNKHTAACLAVVKIFDGDLIYGIRPNFKYNRCLMYGRTVAKVCRCDLEKFSIKEPMWKDCGDWILDGKWIDDWNNIVTVLMHNIVILWSSTLTKLQYVRCEEVCLSYSSHLVNDTWENLVVLSGTVFSAVLIWQPNKTTGIEVERSPVLCRLSKHKGSVFSVHYNSESGIICSTSDDRAAIIWSVQSKDLLKELAKEEVDIQPIKVVYGHLSRVFGCRVLKNYILTAGEDSCINILTNKGKLVRQLKVHQGAALWSLDCDETLVATGAGDSGVMMFALHNYVERAEMNERNDKEYPTKVVLLGNSVVVAISDKGELQYHDGTKWISLARHTDLISYALLEVSYCRNLIGLAGIFGTVHIYKLTDVPKELYFHVIEDKSRIYSFHWLSCTYYLTCSAEGVLRLWRIKSKSPFLYQQFQLPVSKERWTTAACFCGGKRLAVGDRKGYIYLYSLDTDLPNPIQTFKKVHNHLGVTDLFYSTKQLISLGRDSTIKKYSLSSCEQQLLTSTSCDKLAFAWLAKIRKIENNILIAGFRENDFILWSCKRRCPLLQIPCGGGHRSWDFSKSGEFLDIVYIKEKIIHFVRYNWENVHVKEFVQSFHVNVINSIIGIPLLGGKLCIFISGGEDTTLRISTTSFNFVNDLKSDFKTLSTLKSHLSSIRVIKHIKVNDNRYYMFSGGGRGQIIFWEIVIDFQEILKIECTEIMSVHASNCDTRVMDLCVVLKEKCCLLLSACSDGVIAVFKINPNDEKPVVRCGSVAYKSKCIFKIAHLEIFNHDIVMSMATDGKIVFWDFTEVVQSISKVVVFKCIHVSQVHQSGINSFTQQKVSGDTYMFLTGGDDRTIFINICKFSVNNNQIRVQFLSTFRDNSSHCAQITGTYIGKNHVFTTSVDQKLNIFKYNIVNDKIECKFIRRHNSSVVDIQGMLCYDNDTYYYVLLYGFGIEICKVIL